MSDRVTLTAQVSPDSELYQKFEEHEKKYSSRAEAIRHALEDGLNDDTLTRQEFREAMRRHQLEAQTGAWESAALSASFLLAATAIVVAVATILPLVPSFEGIATGTILLAAAVSVLVAVQRGLVEQLELRFGNHDPNVEQVMQGVSE